MTPTDQAILNRLRRARGPSMSLHRLPAPRSERLHDDDDPFHRSLARGLDRGCDMDAAEGRAILKQDNKNIQ